MQRKSYQQRADGVTLGQCDLNFISVKQMDEIPTVCGIPGTIDTPTENQCQIRAVVSPDPITTADRRKLYKVLELWSVDKPYGAGVVTMYDIFASSYRSRLCFWH